MVNINNLSLYKIFYNVISIIANKRIIINKLLRFSMLSSDNLLFLCLKMVK